MRYLLALLVVFILGQRCLCQVKDAEFVLKTDVKRICEQDLLLELDSALSKSSIPAALHGSHAAPNDRITLVPLETAVPSTDPSLKLFTPFQREFDRGRRLSVFDQVSRKFENNAVGFLNDSSYGNTVFLSYTRPDHTDAVKVAELLRQEGFDVFTYLTYDGDFFTTASNVGRAYATSSHRLLLQSSNSRLSDAVNREIIATRTTPAMATLGAFSSADWQQLSKTKFFALSLPASFSISVNDVGSAHSSRFRLNTGSLQSPNTLEINASLLKSRGRFPASSGSRLLRSAVKLIH